MTAETPGTGELRQDIERTRERLGETVEQLAAKTDVKGQAKARAAELAGAAKTQLQAKAAPVASAVAAAAGLTAIWLVLRWWRNR